MIDHGRHSILGVHVDAVDYDTAVLRFVEAADARHPFAASALAVHGVMTGALDREHAARLNGLDLAVPDGQPVRWALRWLHGAALPDRVYGPELMLRAADALCRRGLSVYLYGSTRAVLDDLEEFLALRFPDLEVAGSEPSRFRRLTQEEHKEMIRRIEVSGANAVLLGLGSPRQEIWAWENREVLAVPVLAVGAAFDFHAGRKSQAPAWMQQRGLEWAFRLAQEPSRLWRRYLLLNPLFLVGIAAQRLGWTARSGTQRSPTRMRIG